MSDHPLKNLQPSMDTLYIHALLHLSLDNLSASVRYFLVICSRLWSPRRTEASIYLVPQISSSFSHYPYSQIGSAQNFYIFANVMNFVIPDAVATNSS